MGFSPECSNNIHLQNSRNFLSYSPLASALALSSVSSSFQPVDSFITFISLQSSYAWYLKLSQFETVFLAYLMLQVAFFRYLEILPININNFFLGDPSGRKRRRRKRWSLKQKTAAREFDCENDTIMTSMLKVLQKLDDGKCVSMSLCEMELIASKANPKNDSLILPKSALNILAVLKASAKYRKEATQMQLRDLNVGKDSMSNASQYSNSSLFSNNFETGTSVYCPALDGLKDYENAVILGSSISEEENYHNSSICEQRYSTCPLTKQDAEHYIGVLIKANML